MGTVEEHKGKQRSTLPEVPYRSADEHRAMGKALRDAAPRTSHAGWQPSEDRRDPVDILTESNAGRLEQLVPIRFGRMASSPFAFYRGAAALMAADLATTPTSGIRVQACGDAHLMNFGGFATPERNVIFDINDLDETLPAPFEWDLKRLAASVVIAAQHLRLPESDAARTATEVVREYRESLPEHTRILFDRYHFFDYAVKVVGVGSVGTTCGVCLFMAADDDPLFLQVKEARASVLEPYAGKRLHSNHGQRVVVGQRIMQAASDVFLGWTRTATGLDVYVRQLRDMKISPVLEDWDTRALQHFGRMCATALARAHARSGDAAMMAGYMGSGQTFDDAVGEFAVEYADQNQRDFRAFTRAIRDGRLPALVDV